MKATLHAILTLSLIGLSLCSGFAQPLQDVIRLRLTNTDNGLFDETVIRFHPDATVGYDPNYDAWKLFSIVPAAPSFFSRSPQGWDMTINSYPSLLQDYALDLYTLIQVGGNFTLDYEILGPFSPDVTIRLEDKQTGVCHAVLSDLPIAFSLPASADTTSRFRMVFSTPLKVTTLHNPCPGGRSGQVAIADPGNPSWSYHLHNGAGTLVAQSSQVAEQDTIMGLASGAYTLTAFGSCGSADTLAFELREGNGPELSATVSPSICGASLDGWIDLTVERAHPPYSYLWSHGDTVQDPADIGGGQYTVTVTDRFQCRDSLAVTLDEREPIVANFRTTNNTTLYFTGDTVHFINISEGAQAYRWDFGDGHQSADEHPSHVFEGTGDYPVSLTAYYDDCAPDVREHWLTLQEKLTTSIAPNPGTRPPFHISQRGQQLLLSGNAHQREQVQVTIHDLSGRQLFQEEITLLPGEPSALSVTPRTGQILLLHVSSSSHSKTERYAFH